MTEEFGDTTLKRTLVLFAALIYLNNCASAPVQPPPPPPEVEPQETTPIVEEPPLPFEVGRSRIPDYSQQPIDIAPDISADTLPESSFEERKDQTATPPLDPTPDIGRRLPKLIFSDELGLYTAPSATYRIYFDQGAWYVLSEGIWFRSKSNEGPWERIDVSDLPEKLQ